MKKSFTFTFISLLFLGNSCNERIKCVNLQILSSKQHIRVCDRGLSLYTTGQTVVIERRISRSYNPDELFWNISNEIYNNDTVIIDYNSDRCEFRVAKFVAEE